MIDIRLPEKLSQEFLSLIPSQQKVVDELFKTGKLTNYALSADQSKLWVSVLAEDEEDVWRILGEFPLISFMDVEIHELAFHHRAMIAAIPSFSLN